MSEEPRDNLDIEKIEENVEDELKKLPRENAKRVVESFSVSKSGPLPDPEDFRRYEETLPGAADRILKIAEIEQTHRHKLSDKDMTMYHENTFKLTKFGMSTGLISSGLGSASGVLIAIFGNFSSSAVLVILLASILPVIVGALKDLFKGNPKSSNEESEE